MRIDGWTSPRVTAARSCSQADGTSSGGGTRTPELPHPTLKGRGLAIAGGRKHAAAVHRRTCAGGSRETREGGTVAETRQRPAIPALLRPLCMLLCRRPCCLASAKLVAFSACPTGEHDASSPGLVCSCSRWPCWRRSPQPRNCSTCRPASRGNGKCAWSTEKPAGGPTITSQMCIDAATDRELMEFGLKMSKGNCQRFDMKKTGRRLGDRCRMRVRTREERDQDHHHRRLSVDRRRPHGRHDGGHSRRRQRPAADADDADRHLERRRPAPTA